MKNKTIIFTWILLTVIFLIPLMWIDLSEKLFNTEILGNIIFVYTYLYLLFTTLLIAIPRWKKRSILPLNPIEPILLGRLMVVGYLLLAAGGWYNTEFCSGKFCEIFGLLTAQPLPFPLLGESSLDTIPFAQIVITLAGMSLIAYWIPKLTYKLMFYLDKKKKAYNNASNI